MVFSLLFRQHLAVACAASVPLGENVFNDLGVQGPSQYRDLPMSLNEMGIRQSNLRNEVRFWRKAVVPNIGCVRLDSKVLDIVRN
jgi:hypothetical protein